MENNIQETHPIAGPTGSISYNTNGTVDINNILYDSPDTMIVSQIRERYRIGLMSNNQAYDRIDNLEIYAGRKRVTVQGTKTQPKVNINIIKTAVDIIASVLNDAPSDIECYANTPDDEVRAIIWQKIMDHIVEQNTMDYKNPQMKKFLLCMGTGVFKVVAGNGIPLSGS